MKNAIIILLSLLIFLNCKKESSKILKKENNKTVINDTIIFEALEDKKDSVLKITTKEVYNENTKTLTPKELPVSKNKRSHRLRKFNHVTKFYERLSVDATRVCMEHNIPPASLLAIAGLESGWNNGYIGQITGNILSLGASSKRNDIELPALTLPRLKKGKKILFDSIEIIKYNQKDYNLEQRPSSLKKDYRPKRWAGTKYNLAYLEHHPDAKAKAHAQNVEDFVTVFISRESRISAYRNTRKKMDNLVKKHGKEILLKEETAIAFIHGIGGKKNSYNFRKSWPKKVIKIIRKVGLVPLTHDLYNGKTFAESW